MGIQRQKSLKVLLLGDHCEDVYHYGVCERISPEAPVPVLKKFETVIKDGMSSNVKNNLESFGIKVVHYHNKEKIRKHRLVDSRYNQHLIRYDEGEGTLLTELNLNIIENLKKVDAVVISDYNKGFLRTNTLIEVCKMFENTPIFVDTKKEDLTMLSGCVIKINEKEFANIKRMPKDSEFVVTLGEGGALYNNKVYDTNKTEVFDVCGAGDVFLSSLVYGYLTTQNMEDAIIIANKCASLSVSKMGTYVLTKEDVENIL